MLRDAAELGTRYELKVTTLIDRHELAEARILNEAERRHGFIVMGVSRRPGDALFFGNTATALLQKWKGPILFVAS